MMRFGVSSLLFVAACHASGTSSTASAVPDAVCPVPEHPAAPSAALAIDPSSPATAGAFVLRDAVLVDGTGRAPLPDTDIFVQDGRIAGVGKDLEVPDGVTEVDARGYTVLPGFIDAHTHMVMDPPDSYAAGVERQVRETDADRALRGVRNARATLLAGFTTVRNVGGGMADRALRDAIDAGLVPGPRMLVANHSIGTTGGHCDDTNALRPEVFGEVPDFREGIGDGPDELRKAVRYQIKYGADVIKICATGGVLSQGDGVGAPQLTVEEMRVIVEEAVRAERKVAAHAHGNQGIKEAIAAGVHSIEHGSILDDEAIAAMKRRGVFLVPTTYVGRYVVERAEAGALSPDSARKAKEIAPKMQRSFRMAYEAGVPIALGSDAGVFPHGRNGKEFTTMVELGMKPMDAIVAGTSAAARLLGLSDVGRIVAGMRADLVLVKGDPLEDITVLERPEAVVKDGVFVVDRTGRLSPQGEATP
ncbi:MAG: amidohydrolase family protein [Deltaproteobacteria bacterium]|nr:MAG: amidohydrolase family protein [Deltaproteobacteria bacterium]